MTLAVLRDRYGARPRLDEIAVPGPRAGDVLVRVVASSLNTADNDISSGRPPAARIGHGIRRPTNPRLGLDVVGVIEAVGDDVTGFAPGDTVWADVFVAPGAFAELVVAPAKVVSHLPAGIRPEDAACLPHSGVLALQSLQTGRGVHAGDRVLVNGAGGCVGPLATQIATAWGAEVTGVDVAAKFEVMRRAGATEVVDFTTTDCTRLGPRFDVVIDIAGNHGVRALVRALAPAGQVVRVARDVSGFIAAAALGGRRAVNVSWSASDAEDLATLADLLQRGALTPIVDRTCTLADVPAELARLQAGATRGKVVVRI